MRKPKITKKVAIVAKKGKKGVAVGYKKFTKKKKGY